MDRAHQMWSHGVNSSNDAADTVISIVEFNREILRFDGGGPGGVGEGEGVNGGEERVHGREQDHVDV